MKPGGTCWDETGCSVDTWNPFQTQLKPVLLCSVYRTLIDIYYMVPRLTQAMCVSSMDKLFARSQGAF